MEPPGKVARKISTALPPGFELSRDHRHQMVDVLIGLQPFVLQDPHRPGPADLAQVVSQQVHDHGELGVILEALGQFLPQDGIRRRGGPPGPGPLDGAGLEIIAPPVQKALHGGREHLKIITVQIGVKRRRVELEEPLQQVVRLPGQGKRKALGQVDLVDVTGPDILRMRVRADRYASRVKLLTGGPHSISAQGRGRGP